MVDVVKAGRVADMPAEVDEVVALVRAAKANPNPHFTPLYQRFVRPIYRYISSRVKNVEDCKDITSEVFEAVLKGLHRAPDKQFPKWIFGIAQHKVADHFRKCKVINNSYPLVHQPDSHTNVEREIEQNEATQQLLRQLVRLKQDEQDLLALHYGVGFTYREIAEIKGKSDTAIKQKFYNLRCKLRDQGSH